MTKLRRLAHRANRYVKGWLLRQPALQEETITDWVLDYFKRSSTEIAYYQFDHWEEGKFTGADWDWWILLPRGRCFCVRVQAKKLKPGQNHYRDLAHPDDDVRQMDLLLDSSEKYRFYPMYAFYGWGEDNLRTAIRHSIPTVLFVASAQEIYDMVFGKPRVRILADALVAVSSPLADLFLPPHRAGGAGTEFNLNQFFGNSPQNNRDRSGSYVDDNRGKFEQVPPVVASLFETRTDTDHSAVLLKEYQSQFVGSKGVFITLFPG